MSFQLKSRQRGVSFIGLIFVAAVLACAGVVGAQVFPTVVEYQSATKAIEKAKSGSSIEEMRTLFDKAAQVDDIKSITGKDLDIAKNGDKVVIKFAYVKEIHLAGPAFLVLKYSGQSK